MASDYLVFGALMIVMLAFFGLIGIITLATGYEFVHTETLFTHFSEYCNGERPTEVYTENGRFIVECPEEVNANVNVVVRGGNTEVKKE